MKRSTSVNSKMMKSSFVLVPSIHPSLVHSEKTHSKRGNHQIHIDENSASEIAKMIFDHYSNSRTSKIGVNEARQMISDTNSFSKNSKNRVKNEKIQEYFSAQNKSDKEGFTLWDIEEASKRFLCGPGGLGLNLTSEKTESEKVLNYLYPELESTPYNNDDNNNRLEREQK